MSDIDLPGIPPHWRNFCREIGAVPFEIINADACDNKAAHIRCLWSSTDNGAIKDTVLILRVFDDGSFVIFTQVHRNNLRIAARLT